MASKEKTVHDADERMFKGLIINITDRVTGRPTKAECIVALLLQKLYITNYPRRYAYS